MPYFLLILLHTCVRIKGVKFKCEFSRRLVMEDGGVEGARSNVNEKSNKQSTTTTGDMAQ